MTEENGQDGMEAIASPLVISDDVSEALTREWPVVAFETTILSFGLPWPRNFEVGTDCEKIARAAHCLPATLAILDGKIRVGLSEDEIRLFCTPDQNCITKVNLQNVAYAVQRRIAGALTVAASMQVCAGAGIRVFSTGGIGGVHRDYARYHDSSSDMAALARYPVAVVCAGAKSVLDICATLEQLETLGVPIYGYQTKTFPLFHARTSPHKLDTWFDDINDLAAAVRIHWSLAKTGVLVVTPVPEESAIPPGELEEWVVEAEKAARIGRLHGKALTPFLLKKLEKLSNGRTLETNLALARNNAKVACALASAI